jgi:predicted membrane GTPase involved in stress response
MIDVTDDSQHVTNMRSVQKEEFVRLTPPKILTLEETMAYCRGDHSSASQHYTLILLLGTYPCSGDEMIEVTPKSIRLRKGSLGKRRKGDDDE